VPPMRFRSATVSDHLARLKPEFLTAWCVVAAFTTYFSMYAFRKPYTVAKYEGIDLSGIDYKIILLFSQVGGYAISKFLGIKIISEMTPHRRALTIVGLIAVAHLALLPYAIAPYWLKPFFLFLNGLPLGMVFGCVFAFLEGRKQTEAMAAGLCASFIMASGTVKSVGAMLMDYQGVSQFWMPFATGAIFWIPLLVGVWMLEQIPPPSAHDIDARASRPPINRAERRAFFARFWFGVSMLILLFVLLTIFRSVREDYAAEIWSDFGVEAPEVFAQSETIVAVIAVLLSAATVFVRGNFRAFQISMLAISAGFVLALVTTLLHWNTQQWTDRSAFIFMVLIGICLYVPYVLFHTTVFERLLATVRDKANYGYLMYLGDFTGYMATVVLMVLFDLILKDTINYVGLLFWLALIISPISIVISGLVILYFRRRQKLEAEKNPDFSEPVTALEVGASTSVS